MVMCSSPTHTASAQDYNIVVSQASHLARHLFLRGSVMHLHLHRPTTTHLISDWPTTSRQQPLLPNMSLLITDSKSITCGKCSLGPTTLSMTTELKAKLLSYPWAL